MKIAYKLFLIALGFIAIFSCTNELADSDQSYDSLLPSVFTAVKEGTPIPSSPTAKSALNADATAVLWTSDDKISIFGKTGTHSILSVMNINETSATFGGEVEAEGPYYAVTPYDAANALSEGNKLQVVVPSVQTPLAACGNVDPASLVAVGKADAKNQIYFYNVCGMLAFNVEDEAVSEIRLEGAEGNNLAGKAIIAYSENPSVVSVSDASNYITIKPEGDTFSTGIYYVSVLPVTLNGLTVTISKGEDKTVVYEVSDNIEVKRSVVRNVLKSTENEYEYNGYITDAASLNKFLAKASASTEDNPVKGVILNDIDLSNATITSATVLYGELDGRGHSIKNWSNNAEALIAVNYGSVKNIIIDESCTLSAPSELTNADFGVLIKKQEATGKCIGCKNYADIEVVPTSMSTTWRFALLIGHNNQGYIEGCENHGNISITLNDAQKNNFVVGGVVGYCKGKVVAGEVVAKNCKNSGNIVFQTKNTAKSNSIGGVIGMTPVHKSTEFKNTGKIIGCENSGNITYTIGVNGDGSYTNIGGVIGYCEGDMESCKNSGNVSHSNNTSSAVACTRPAVGGVAGCVGYSMINCENTGVVEFEGYTKHGAVENFAGGSIRPAFGGVVGAIGSSADIAGSVLNNCDNSGELHVTNHMVATSVNDERTEPMMGGIAGYARVAVSNCDNKSKVVVSSSGYYTCAGGVAGRVWGTNKITSCSNAAELSLSTFGSGTNVGMGSAYGGVIGRADNSTEQCSNSGNLIVNFNSTGTSFNYVGGIAGVSQAMTNCTNSGNLTTSNRKVRLGGLAGQGGGAISGCYVLNSTITLKNANADSEVGGFAAYCNANISNSGFVGTIDNQSTNSTYTGGLVAGVRGQSGDNPIISNTYLNVTLKAANSSGKNGLIYGGQYAPKVDCTITLGQENKTLKVLNTSTFLGTAVTQDTPVVGYYDESKYKLTINKTYLEFVDSLPTEDGASNSSFQGGSNWNGTWN